MSTMFTAAANPNRRNALRQSLRLVALETRSILPDIMSQLPNFDITTSSAHSLENLSPLDPHNCPRFKLPEGDEEVGRKGTRMRVYDQDNFDAALQLQLNTTVSSVSFPDSISPNDKLKLEETPATDSSANPKLNSSPASSANVKPVAVLNLASEMRPGGGWLNGALAQEEALCYRSSLSLSLHPEYYPIPPLSALYSPSVVIIRSSMSDGHTLLWPEKSVEELDVVSVITLAALRRPMVNREGKYVKEEDRRIMKSKMRAILRVAVHQGHTKVVLGALGCGAFGNPSQEVANCFLEIFGEEEFQGGWWEEVVFAVLDNAGLGQARGKEGVGNFGVFYRALDGVVV
ncbi:hypothetical protein CC78DRAFT_492301 [Lojkania enalia]|uniref:Microbial-type PARG catalytic domain-containing protein n=1 Tax=Lojkania enalia TaxID=147567 RepID=A0A9P4N8R6_9PLEO|nr:hypothetical protein CC78DRAFT_492301 [Didymosphaeria enalia]